MGGLLFDARTLWPHRLLTAHYNTLQHMARCAAGDRHFPRDEVFGSKVPFRGCCRTVRARCSKSAHETLLKHYVYTPNAQRETISSH